MKKLIVFALAVMVFSGNVFGARGGGGRGFGRSSYGRSSSRSYSRPSSRSSGGRVSVRGYYRKDGTYVSGHTRSAPGGGSSSYTGGGGFSYTPSPILPKISSAPKVQAPSVYSSPSSDAMSEKRELENTRQRNSDIRTACMVIRTANQTLSTFNRIKKNEDRTEIARENLEVRKYNSGLNSSFGYKTSNDNDDKKTEVTPAEAERIIKDPAWFKERYEYFQANWTEQKDKTSKLAEFYRQKAEEYKQKYDKAVANT